MNTYTTRVPFSVRNRDTGHLVQVPANSEVTVTKAGNIVVHTILYKNGNKMLPKNKKVITDMEFNYAMSRGYVDVKSPDPAPNKAES